MECHTFQGRNSRDESNKFSISISKRVPFIVPKEHSLMASHYLKTFYLEIMSFIRKY